MKNANKKNKNLHRRRLSPYSLLLSVIYPLLATSSLQAGEIVFGYGTYGGMPYAEENDNEEIVGGITYDLGQEIAQRLQATPRFVKVPVKRVQQYLEEGKMDLICLYHPQFVDHPERLAWSVPFFRHTESFVVRENQKLNDYSQLKGADIGAELGYVYSDRTEQLFRNGFMHRFDQQKDDTLFRLLSMGRLTAVISDDLTFHYRRLILREPIQLSELTDNEYDLSCAVSRKSPVDMDRLNQVLLRMVDEGAMKKLLARYRLDSVAETISEKPDHLSTPSALSAEVSRKR